MAPQHKKYLATIRTITTLDGVDSISEYGVDIILTANNAGNCVVKVEELDKIEEMLK